MVPLRESSRLTESRLKVPGNRRRATRADHFAPWYETTTDPSQAIACNCSICAKHGLWLTFVPPQQFKLVSGLDDLANHQFNKHIIHHVFCRTCGVESFARGKTKDGKDMFAINVRCLDGVDIATLKPKPFDGRKL
jgi:hypothetical protein